MSPEQKHILKVWIAAGLWMVLIALESTALMSAANTSRILFPILHFLFGITWAQFQPWHHLIRKTGHVLIYFMLSVLLFRAWKVTLRLPSEWAVRWAGIAWCMSAFVASMDEWHQSFLPSRTGVFSDVVLDSTAALAAQIAIFFWWQAKMREG